MCRAFGQSVSPAASTDLKQMSDLVEQIDPPTFRRGMHREIAKLQHMPTLHDQHCAAEMTTVVAHIKTFLKQFAARIES